MKIEDVKKGMKVLILPSACEEKYDSCSPEEPGWSDEMKGYVGTVQTVSKIYDAYKRWVEIDTWVFKVEDLWLVSETSEDRKKVILKEIKKLIKELEKLD